MNSKLRSTLSGLSVIGIFLAASLLLAQPLSSTTEQGAKLSRQTISNPLAGETLDVSDVTFRAEQGLGTVKLSLTLPYFAIGRLLAAQTES